MAAPRVGCHRGISSAARFIGQTEESNALTLSRPPTAPRTILPGRGLVDVMRAIQSVNPYDTQTRSRIQVLL